MPCSLGERGPTLPAVVVLHDDGSALVGEDAERLAGLELTRVARSLRHDPLLQQSPITVAGEVRTPYELLRALYATMARRAGAIEGGVPRQVVLTHPVVPEGTRCETVERIADELFPGALVVPDPVAATVKLACDGVLPNDCLVAVYDLGGGTFDTSLVQRHDDRFSIVGDPAGVPDFGGIDIDDLVLDHVDRSLHGAVSRLDLGDPAAIDALHRLRWACRDAKERLSYETAVVIDVQLPGNPAVVEITRAELEAMLRPHLEHTVDVLIDMIDRSGVRSSDVDAVALVGGSSRIPAVADLVSARTGMHVLVDPYPELTVALGGAQMSDEEQTAAAPADVPLADAAPVGAADPLAQPYVPPVVPTPGPGSAPFAGGPHVPGRSSDPALQQTYDEFDELMRQKRLAPPTAPPGVDHVATSLEDLLPAVPPGTVPGADPAGARSAMAAGGPPTGDEPVAAAADPTVTADATSPYEYDDDEFDLGGSRSRLGEMVDQGVPRRAGVAVLSAAAGVVVVVAGALALGDGGGDGGSPPDTGNVSALGADDVDDTSSDTTAGSSGSSDSTTSSTTADDGRDDDDGRGGDGGSGARGGDDDRGDDPGSGGAGDDDGRSGGGGGGSTTTSRPRWPERTTTSSSSSSSS
ncbi:MAG TPA: Hsp70 family protein, partial [Acidimicrobiales bacterium]